MGFVLTPRTVPLIQPTVPFGSRTRAQPFVQPRIWYCPPTGTTVTIELCKERPLRTFMATVAVDPLNVVVAVAVDAAAFGAAEVFFPWTRV